MEFKQSCLLTLKSVFVNTKVTWKASHEDRLFQVLTFLYCPNSRTSPPFVIYSKLSMVCVHLQIHSRLIPDQISGTSTPVPWVPLLPSDLVPEIILSICPYTLELPPGGNCPVQVFVILQDGCSFPSCVIFGCIILFCLVLFSLPFSLLFFSLFSVCPLFLFCLVYLGIPLIYCSSILGFAWLQAECYNKSISK